MQKVYQYTTHFVTTDEQDMPTEGLLAVFNISEKEADAIAAGADIFVEDGCLKTRDFESGATETIAEEIIEEITD